MTAPRLFLPGPTQVAPEVLAAMARPMVGHRSKAIRDLVVSLGARLGPVFGTRRPVCLETCPATALMEAAIRNLVPRRVLNLTCGAFSERWHKVALACGREAEALAVEWGNANAPGAVEEALRGGGFDAVAITHCETSTGVLNPLAELAAAARRFPGVLVLVDVVSSLGGTQVDFDRLGLDLAFAGVQKALALPPGMTVFALSERALERAREVPARGWLLDFSRTVEAASDGATLATPSIPHLRALEVQLRRMEAETLPARFARHEAMAALVRRWASGRGMQVLAPPAFASPTVTGLRAPSLDVPRFLASLAAAGFVAGSGYGRFKADGFRVGHMGEHTPADVQELLDAADRVLGEGAA